MFIHPHSAKLFQSIFHSFKAGIANAISSFKWRKNHYLWKKDNFQFIEMNNRASPTNYFDQFIQIEIYIKKQRKYTVPTA